MRTRISLLVFLVAFLMPVNSDAQVSGFLKNKISKAVTSKIKDKDSTATAASDQAGANQESKGLPGLGIGKVKVNYETNYSYTGLMKSKVELYEKGSLNGTMISDTWFDPANMNVAIEMSGADGKEAKKQVAAAGTVICDMVNKVLIMLTENENGKSGIISPIPDSVLVEKPASAEETDGDYKVVKTGNTREIAGYKCDEYEVTHGKDLFRMWTTKNIDFKLNKKTMRQSGMPKYYSKIPDLGAVLASEEYSNNVIVTKTEVLEIDKNRSHSVSTEGYQLMQINMFKGSRDNGK